MNISDNINIVNINKTGCSVAHIRQCLSDASLHDAPIYEYYGSHVQRGTVDIHTKNGTFKMKFRAENSWITDAEII